MCLYRYEDDPEPEERVPAGLLYVPARPGGARVVVRLFRTPLGARTAVGFTSPGRLADTLGAEQPWIRLSGAALRALAEPLGAVPLTVDPTLTAPPVTPAPEPAAEPEPGTGATATATATATAGASAAAEPATGPAAGPAAGPAGAVRRGGSPRDHGRTARHPRGRRRRPVRLARVHDHARARRPRRGRRARAERAERAGRRSGRPFQRRTRGMPRPIHEMISRWISLFPPPKVKMTALR
ncbi:SAV_915 family protein [Streptomyces sp. NPDC055254]